MVRRELLVGVLLVALLAAQYGFLLSQSIRLDESQSLWVGTKSVESILRSHAENVHVPLYSLLLHYWLQLWGTSVIAARLLSLLFFVATLPVIYLLAREVSTKRVATVTLILFATSPFVLWFSAEARMYTLFLLAVSLHHLLFWRLVKSKGRTGVGAYFLSTLLGFYTHYFFMFHLAAQGLFLVGTWLWSTFTRKHSWAGPVLASYIWAVAGASLLFLPWVTWVIQLGFASHTQPLIPLPTSFNVLQLFSQLMFGIQSVAVQAIIISLWPVATVLLFFVFTQRKTGSSRPLFYFLTVAVLPVLMVFAISHIKPIFLSRYLIFIAPSLFFLMAWMIMNYSRRLALTLAVTLWALMSVAGWHQFLSSDIPIKEQYRAAAEYLSEETTARDVVVVTAPFTVYPIEYHYQGEAWMETFPRWNRYVSGAIHTYSEEDLAARLTVYRGVYDRLFVIYSYDQGYEHEMRHYLDTHLETKDTVQFSPGVLGKVYQLRYAS